MPQPYRLALVGGTSLLESPLFQGAEPQLFTTPYGEVTLLEKAGILFLQRHGLESYTPPHRINHRANFYALHQSGVEKILAVGSVGSMRENIVPGTLLIPDDFYAPHLGISLFEDQRGHQAPGFHRQWRATIVDHLQQANLEQLFLHGTYWQTVGPRFETPAEIRMMQPHVHVVGMTVAAEVILAGELELPYAAICMVDNFANGIGDEALSYATFKTQVNANEAQLLNTLNTLIEAILS